MIRFVHPGSGCWLSPIPGSGSGIRYLFVPGFGIWNGDQDSRSVPSLSCLLEWWSLFAKVRHPFCGKTVFSLYVGSPSSNFLWGVSPLWWWLMKCYFDDDCRIVILMMIDEGRFWWWVIKCNFDDDWWSAILMMIDEVQFWYDWWSAILMMIDEVRFWWWLMKCNFDDDWWSAILMIVDEVQFWIFFTTVNRGKIFLWFGLYVCGWTT